MAFSFSELVNSLYQALTRSKKELRPYDVLPLQYNVSGQVNLMRPCNGWTVINQGTTSVQVNGTVMLTPQQMIAVSGNEGEMYTGFLRLNFASNTDAGNNVLVVQKFFVAEDAKFDKIGM